MYSTPRSAKAGASVRFCVKGVANQWRTQAFVARPERAPSRCRVHARNAVTGGFSLSADRRSIRDGRHESVALKCSVPVGPAGLALGRGGPKAVAAPRPAADVARRLPGRRFQRGGACGRSA